MLILAIDESAKDVDSKNNDESIIIVKGRSLLGVEVVEIVGKVVKIRLTIHDSGYSITLPIKECENDDADLESLSMVLIGRGEDQVEIIVIRIAGKTVRFGFKAGKHIPINRKSVHESKFETANCEVGVS